MEKTKKLNSQSSENFYPINLRQGPAKYGDIVLFLDVPTEALTAEDVDFHWIKHATTYLVDQFVFAKGSSTLKPPTSSAL